jgi:hypothetical protein
MALETTTTTLNDVVYGYIIEPTFLDYAHDWVVATPFFRRYSLIGKPSNVLQVPRFATDMGTVGDGGGGVDGEFDATEGTDLSTNTTQDTDNVQFTVAEYGLVRKVTDNVKEDSILGSDMSMYISDAARILTTAVEDSACALFASLSNSVGVTTSDLTIAQAVSAADGIRERGCRAPNGVTYVLDDQQYNDLRDACIATDTSWASFPQVASTLLDVQKDPINGLGNGRVMSFRGFDVYATGLTDTANTGADVVGACFTHTGPGNDAFATFAIVDKRPFRIETERDATLRADELVFTTRVAVGEATDASGTKILSDAP